MLILILVLLFFVVLLMLAELITVKKEMSQTRKLLEDIYHTLQQQSK
ncbi:hypothetical protein [Peribacillus tepidiphilus]